MFGSPSAFVPGSDSPLGQAIGMLNASSPAALAAMLAQGQVAREALDNAAQYVANTPNRMKAGLDEINRDFAASTPPALRAIGGGGTEYPPYDKIPYDPNALLRLAMHFGPGAIDEMASRASMLYNPPAKAPRPFAADYPSGAPTDAAGKLLADLDGRPLGARYVAGRKVAGGVDEAIPPAELNALATALTGDHPLAVAPRALPQGAVGAYRTAHDPETGEAVRQILLANNAQPAQVPRVLAHEIGHAIDELAGQIPIVGLDRELRGIYNTLNTGRERTTGLTGPQHLGYRGEDVPRELMAEAIRAYMTDPNYLKTVAPKVAARIRQTNTNPVLAPHIQFNTFLPFGALAPLAAFPSQPQSGL